MEYKALFLIIVFLGTVGLVSAVPSVQLVDTNAISYINIYQYNVSIHNNLTGLQGGSAPNEYYHLTAAEYSTLESIVAESGEYLNLSGGTMSGTINMDDNSLTNVGELIMSGLITSENIYPDTDSLYSIGNSTHYFGSGYFDNLYARGIDTDSINATDLISTNIDSTNLDSVNIDSTNINGTNMESKVLEVENNMTLGSFVVKDDGADMVIILT